MGLFKKEKDMIRTREQLELFAKRLVVLPMMDEHGKKV
jgi:hypothetical protein